MTLKADRSIKTQAALTMTWGLFFIMFIFTINSSSCNDVIAKIYESE
jgi:hypothetical protein